MSVRPVIQLLCGLCLACAIGCKSLHTIPATQPTPPPTPYHLHLNGIGGYRSIDRYMLMGLRDGGLSGEVQAYDWTGSDVGLGALLVKARHTDQSRRVAEMILVAARAQPGRRITVSCHSAGAGILVWALETLPPDVTIDSMVMIAPALSPAFNLTPALRHVSGKVYVFYSPFDAAVLGFGTNMFGTVDGVKTDAAGRVGFTIPPTADKMQYAKLVQVPYNSGWIRLGNIGDHIGPMTRPFAREVIAPLLLRGELPRFAPATRPASSQPVAAE